MSLYTTRMITDAEIKQIVNAIETGYTGKDGIKHKPNKQISVILTLQANLGCRIGDIVHLTAESFFWDGDAWTLDIVEQKTGKARNFIVPANVKAYIDNWMEEKNIVSGRLFSIEEYAVWKQLRAVTDYLGMQNVSAHSFRKNAGFRVYKDSGMDIALTTQFYQHSAPAVTMKYLRRSSKQMDEAISKSTCLV